MSIQTKLHASLAVQALQRKGVAASAIDRDFMRQLFQTLIPLLLNCFDPDDGQEVKSYVKPRRADKRLRKGIARRAKRAARIHGERLSWSQAVSVAEVLIEQIAETEASDITLVIREHD